MTYYFAKTVDAPFQSTVENIVAALKDHGFGVLTKIDVQGTLKEKIGADFRPYVILGACNPRMPHQALQAEDKIGTMLPCNVIVQEVGGKTRHGVDRSLVHRILKDERPVSDSIEKALGLRMVKVYVAE